MSAKPERPALKLGHCRGNSGAAFCCYNRPGACSWSAGSRQFRRRWPAGRSGGRAAHRQSSGATRIAARQHPSCRVCVTRFEGARHRGTPTATLFSVCASCLTPFRAGHWAAAAGPFLPALRGCELRVSSPTAALGFAGSVHSGVLRGGRPPCEAGRLKRFTVRRRARHLSRPAYPFGSSKREPRFTPQGVCPPTIAADPCFESAPPRSIPPLADPTTGPGDRTIWLDME
jgi:hypothetical protein